MTLLELRGVARTYDGSAPVTALHPTDLAFDAGELVGVVGPSGSGKSTLLALIGTLDRPTAGVLRFDGHDVTELGDRALAALRADNIGFVFQRFHLLAGVSALDNVATGLQYRERSRRKRRDAARGALERVGLAARASHRPGQLSGGEQQRVAIARAIIGAPQLVLADEPTGNLDSATGRSVVELLRGLHHDGATVVIVTHDERLAAALPRRVALRDGRVELDTGT
jgi:putative ABC transport system ATP-binding protein